jgi:ATP-dependent protease HslVU (ClpYQ) peptidase subunit
MTVIAWDGRMLAADKQSTDNGCRRTVTKVHRLPDGGLVGLLGSASHAMELLSWFRSGAHMTTFPDPRNEDSRAWAVRIDISGRILLYGTGPHPEVVEDSVYAGGCGRDYALAAMHLGHDARKAVEVACALDAHCGQGVDALTLHEQQPS